MFLPGLREVVAARQRYPVTTESLLQILCPSLAVLFHCLPSFPAFASVPPWPITCAALLPNAQPTPACWLLCVCIMHETSRSFSGGCSAFVHLSQTTPSVCDTIIVECSAKKGEQIWQFCVGLFSIFCLKVRAPGWCVDGASYANDYIFYCYYTAAFAAFLSVWKGMSCHPCPLRNLDTYCLFWLWNPSTHTQQSERQQTNSNTCVSSFVLPTWLPVSKYSTSHNVYLPARQVRLNQPNISTIKPCAPSSRYGNYNHHFEIAKKKTDKKETDSLAA